MKKHEVKFEVGKKYPSRDGKRVYQVVFISRFPENARPILAVHFNGAAAKYYEVWLSSDGSHQSGEDFDMLPTPIEEAQDENAHQNAVNDRLITHLDDLKEQLASITKERDAWRNLAIQLRNNIRFVMENSEDGVSEKIALIERLVDEIGAAQQVDIMIRDANESAMTDSDPKPGEWWLHKNKGAVKIMAVNLDKNYPYLHDKNDSAHRNSLIRRLESHEIPQTHSHAQEKPVSCAHPENVHKKTPNRVHEKKRYELSEMWVVWYRSHLGIYPSGFFSNIDDARRFLHSVNERNRVAITRADATGCNEGEGL